MRYNVPKFIDIDDRIAFRLNIKQLGWFALAGALMFVVYSIFEFVFFIIISILLLIVAAAFAFYKPQGLSAVNFLGYGFGYILKPKEYFWFRKVSRNEFAKANKKTSQKKGFQEERKSKEKQKTLQELKDLSQVLDKKSDI